MNEHHSSDIPDAAALSPAEREVQFNPRAAVPDHDRLRQERVHWGEAARARHAGRYDIRYGEGPLQRVDAFPATLPRRAQPAPLVVFFHGGYWRAGDKSELHFMAAPLLASGIACVFPNYDLCPRVTVPDIVGQARRALVFSYLLAADLGADPRRLVVAGNSAGAHLAAACLAHGWQQEGLPADFIVGALLVSGIFEPRLALDISVNREIGLTPETAAAADVLAMPLHVPCPTVVAAGGAEPPLWLEQSRRYVDHALRHGGTAALTMIPEANHFSIMKHLRTPEDELSRALIALARAD